MIDDIELLKKRLVELAERAYQRGRPTFSDFLTLDQQTELLRLRLPVAVTLEGGCPNAERRLAVFGENGNPPIRCLRVTSVAGKFAAPLAHRDYLGALMGLGIRREMLGDLLLEDVACYILCLESVAGFIAEELREVGRERVAVEPSEPPESASMPPEESDVVVSSERLDGLISAVYTVSRSESRALCESGRVFINGREIKEADRVPNVGDIISVRGRGRFIYNGIRRETRKGRLRAAVCIYR